MEQVIPNVLPVLLLILFGWLLQKRHFFTDEAIAGITKFVSDFLIPCIIFNTFLTLDIKPAYFGLAAWVFVIQALLMAAGFLLVRVLHLKRRFAALYNCAFAFGFMSLPLFSTVFGIKNMATLTSMGVGHELFIGLVFMPVARIYLKHERVSAAQIGKNLLSPLFLMIFLALGIRGLGLQDALQANLVGQGLLSTISKLGGISTTLILVVVGYRIRFDSAEKIKESFLLVGVRYALIFAIGYTIKTLFMDPLAGGDPYFDVAFFTLVSQHGSVILNAYISEFGSKEDAQIASNAFAINALAGIVLFVVYVSRMALG